MVEFTEMRSMEATVATTIGNPVATTALALFTMGSKGPKRGVKVEGGGGSEPGKPGGTPNGSAGGGIVGV